MSASDNQQENASGSSTDLLISPLEPTERPDHSAIDLPRKTPTRTGSLNTNSSTAANWLVAWQFQPHGFEIRFALALWIHYLM